MNTKIQQELFKLQDLGYKDFQAKLMPTIEKELVIGVRTPELKKYASSLSREEADDFISQLPHEYYEENSLHGFLIAKEKNQQVLFEKLDQFLPYVDNWATCDGIKPKAITKNYELLENKIEEWIHSDYVYEVRFGFGMLMAHFLEEKFDTKHLDWACENTSEEYYIRMMIAWYFATALAKQYDAVVPYLEEKKLPPWTHNKAIQKAIESYRITSDQKEYLRTLKIK